MRLTFKELKDEIAKIVPKSIEYRVDLEAGNIAIVTPVPEKFGGGDGLVGKIAKKIKRKIKIRPDPSIVKPELEAKSLICLLYTSPSPRDQRGSRMPSSA